MADLTKEQYEQLPDFARGDYQEVDGVFKHAGVLKLKGSLNELDSKYKAQLSEVNERLNGFETEKQHAIEAARAKALEEAKSKGDVEAIEKRYQEQMEDLKRRVAEDTRLEVSKEYEFKSAQSRAQAEIADIVAALKPVDEEAAELLKLAISKSQQVTDDGKIIYLNSDGSASSLDKKGFATELVNGGKFKHLRQAVQHTTGAGLANGSLGGSAPVSVGNLGGSKAERTAALAKRFNLPN